MQAVFPMREAGVGLTEGTQPGPTNPFFVKNFGLKNWGCDYPSNAVATSVALCPPNPKELFMATLIFFSRAWCGT